MTTLGIWISESIDYLEQVATSNTNINNSKMWTYHGTVINEKWSHSLKTNTTLASLCQKTIYTTLTFFKWTSKDKGNL